MFETEIACVSLSSSMTFSKLPMRLQNVVTSTHKVTSTFCEPSACLHLTHIWLFHHTVLYLHFPHTVDHLCLSHNAVLHPTKLQPSCAEKRSPSKRLNLIPLCWSHITVFPISLYEQPDWALRMQKTIKIYMSSFHYILFAGTNVIIYIINQERKAQIIRT